MSDKSNSVQNQKPQSQNTQIYIRGIPRRIEEDDLRDLFDKFGKIKDVSIKNGYAFIDFYDPQHAGSVKIVQVISSMGYEQQLWQYSQYTQFYFQSPVVLQGFIGNSYQIHIGLYMQLGNIVYYHSSNDRFIIPYYYQAVEEMDRKLYEGQRLVVERAGERRPRIMKGPQQDDKCFKCGERGHWANECKYKRRRRHSSSSYSRSYSRDRRYRYNRDRPARRSRYHRERRRRSYSSSSRSYSRSKDSRSSKSSRSRSRTSSKSRSRSRRSRSRSRSRSSSSSRTSRSK